jgi:hypothetical protein
MASPQVPAAPARSHPRRVDAEGPRPDLNIGADQVAFFVLKAHEFDEKEPPVAEDEGSNPSDDPISSLSDFADDPTMQEISSFLEALSEEAQNELVAMMWLGRGDFDAETWQQAVAEAGAVRDRHVPSYLLGTPLLGEYVEQGYNLLGYSCAEEEGHL